MNEPIYISVVLSTYNEEKYIAKSIQSILDQTYPYFEFIIVNDGSTDSTLQIVKSFTDPRIVVIDKPNSGLPDSLNRGITAAKYDWIARMDGDDIATHDRFERQVSYIKEDSAVIGGQFISINEMGDPISGKVSNKPLSCAKCRSALLFGMSPLAHPTVLVKKELLIKYGGYDVNFRAAQDVELWSRLVPFVKIINIPEPILFYRQHTNNITNKRKDLQRMLAFLGFMKYVLKLRRPLTSEEFNRFENVLSNKSLIQRNDKYYKWSHDGNGHVRTVKLLMYYMWRLLLILKYRLIRPLVIKEILV